VQEDPIKLDLQGDFLEADVVVGGAGLSKEGSTTVMSSLVLRAGVEPRVSFSAVQVPLPQTVKGQLMSWTCW
jgi:hypothetical protein